MNIFYEVDVHMPQQQKYNSEGVDNLCHKTLQHE